jgi:hypothetical protein
MKCPRCRVGKLFTTANPYRLNKLSDMPKTCPCCGVSYFPEIGFYWGAMYISYGLTVLFSIVNVLLLWWLFGFNLTAWLTGNALLLLLGFPLYYRYSRAIWLSAFVYYREEAHAAAVKKCGGK